MKMKKIIGIIVLTLVTAFSGGQLFAFFYANDSCIAYNACDPEGVSGEKISTGPSTGMGELIIKGAGYFLKSHADMLLFLNRLELSELNGPDYPGMQVLLSSAVANMEKASETYKELISLAGATPYNREVIGKLRVFDYAAFRETGGLSGEIFSRVENLLARGDVTNLYVLLKADMDTLIKQLYTLKTSIDSNTFPDISLVMRLNRKYSESLLTGQYIADVFRNL
jgi:hypothetical protein